VVVVVVVFDDTVTNLFLPPHPSSSSSSSQFLARRGMGELQEWCEASYDFIQKLDAQISDEFAIPR